MSEYNTLTIAQKLKARLAYAGMRIMGWRPISTAPRDGTEILIIEGHSDDRAGIMVARWYTPYSSRDDDAPKPNPYWWGLGWRLGYTHWDSEGPWGKPEHFAASPLWWKPWRKPSRRMALVHYWASWVAYHKRGPEG